MDRRHLPEGWEGKTLGEVCKFQGGSQPPKSQFITEYREGYVRFLQIRDFKSDGYIVYIPVSSKNRLCNETDIMIGRYGASVGQILRGKSGAYNVALIKTMPSEKIIDRNFFFFYLNSSLFQKPLMSVSDRSAQAGFSKEDISSFHIPVPSLDEQKRIVAILDEAFEGIDQAISNTEKNLANARELFDSYLNKIFTQKGDGWEEKKLQDICNVKDGTHDSPKYLADGIPFITQKNIRENGLTFDNIKFISLDDHEKFYTRSNVAFGDILISMIGANRGMAAIVDDRRIFSIKNVGLIKANNNINKYFLLYFLKSNRAKNYIELESKGGAQPFIGLGKLREFPIIIAPKNKQDSIVIELDQLYLETKQLETIYRQKIAALNELKQSILQKAFTGQLTK